MWNDKPAETGVRLEHSPWGYQVNINHPAVRPLFDRYLRWRKIPPWCPLSDAERREFESYVLPKLEEIKLKKSPPKRRTEISESLKKLV